MKAVRWLSLLVSLAVTAPVTGCDDGEKDRKESKSKRKRKKKKKKKRDEKKKDDGDTKEVKDEPTKIAWNDGDFGNAEPKNDVLDMKNTSCNQLINACLACGDRITSKRENANFLFGVHGNIFEALKKKSAADRAKACPDLHKKAKADDDDCIAGCTAVRKELTGK